MGFNTIAINLLEKLVTNVKKDTISTEMIERNTAQDNTSTIVSLDTSITSLTAVNISKLFEGGSVRNVTVLDAGGGLYLQTSLGDPFQVFFGDRIINEKIEILRWYGAGAGTAVLRISGVR